MRMHTKYLHTNYIYFYVWEIYGMYAKRYILYVYSWRNSPRKIKHNICITKIQRREPKKAISLKSRNCTGIAVGFNIWQIVYLRIRTATVVPSFVNDKPYMQYLLLHCRKIMWYSYFWMNFANTYTTCKSRKLFFFKGAWSTKYSAVFFSLVFFSGKCFFIFILKVISWI